MRLPWSVSCVHASVRETEISGWVYVCLHLGVWEVVIWCGSEGGQDENSDLYLCQVYIAY